MKLAICWAFLLASYPLLAKVTGLKIFAASSLTNVLQEIAKVHDGPRVTFNFDATSKLAKQIEAGAPADVFFSADAEWMDYLEARKRIMSSTRTDLLTNRIVLIVPQDAKKMPAHPRDIKADEYAHIALAAESVPAGKAARSALAAQNLLTPNFIKKIVNADNVRVALTWVAKHEAEAGIVYATDVPAEPRVKVAFSFEDSSYPKIIYPVAIVAASSAKPEARRFIEFCRSEKSQAIFRSAGFIIL
jgi:molybdate transport system substrate-binding protein